MHWYPRLDSNQHFPVFETATSAIGLRGRMVPLAGAAPALAAWKAAALLLRHSGKLVPSAGHDPATLRLRVACAAHLRHNGIWCRWRDSPPPTRRLKDVCVTNYATAA
jgi:hypothetical protein